jgi:hypothetical protein
MAKKIGMSGNIWEPEKLVEVYIKYNEFVKTEAKKKGMPLVEWQAEDGWKPLCDFLGKPLPPVTVPFPRTNEKKQMQLVIGFLLVRGLLGWAALGGAAYAAVAFGPKLLRMALGEL